MELQQRKSAVRAGREDKWRSGFRVSNAWLSCYPTFRDALEGGQTSFRALPASAKRAVFNRLAVGATPASAMVAVLDEVRAAYVELPTVQVAATIELSLTAATRQARNVGGTSLKDLAAAFPSMCVPLIARQPCLLSPGEAILLSGWGRFFAYWLRNDETIPLLAVDWPVLYAKLSQQDCGRSTALHMLDS